MPKPTLGEIAALIGVVAALIAGVLFAFGTVAHLSYLETLGFDGHQFPAISSELQVFGGLLGALPTLFVGVVVFAYFCLSPIINRGEAWLIKLPKKWRIPIGLVIIPAAAYFGWLLFSQAETAIFALIFMGTLLLGAIVLGEWVVPTGMMMSCLIVSIFPSVILVMNNKGHELGQARAVRAGKTPATMVIEFKDGKTIPAPGDRIACSERLCGFHDGETATVIFLDTVRSIQSPSPQSTNQQPAAQPGDVDRAPGPAGAPGSDK